MSSRRAGTAGKSREKAGKPCSASCASSSGGDLGELVHVRSLPEELARLAQLARVEEKLASHVPALYERRPRNPRYSGNSQGPHVFLVLTIMMSFRIVVRSHYMSMPSLVFSFMIHLSRVVCMRAHLGQGDPWVVGPMGWPNALAPWVGKCIRASLNETYIV